MIYRSCFMKMLIVGFLLVAMMMPCAYAQEVELPYDEFVQIFDGDMIDFNEDGIAEKIIYHTEQDVDQWFGYTIQVDDSRPIYGGIPGRYGEENYKAPLLFAVRMSFGGNYLFVHGERDNDCVTYDIYEVIETDRTIPYELQRSDSQLVIAQIDTPIFDGVYDDRKEVGLLVNNEFAFTDGDVRFGNDGETWHLIYYDGQFRYVRESDVELVQWEDFYKPWTVRYVDNLDCVGYPEDFRVTNVQTVSNYTWARGLGSPQYTRGEFFIYCKDFFKDGEEYTSRFIGRVFELEHGCYATCPEVYAIVCQEIPLYISRTSNEIGDILQPGDAVASVMADGNGRIYLQQIKPDRYDWDVKGGWIEMDDSYNLILNGQPVEDYSGDIQKYFDGLHFGG